MTINKWIIVSRTGPNSTHPSWIVDDGKREFDVFLSSYDKNFTPSTGDGIFSEYRPGTKVSGYSELLKEKSYLFSKYEYIAFFDDDLVASTTTLNSMFSLCSAYNLKIAQPSLTKNSYFTYAALVQQSRLKIRYVNFIEMMCPIFRGDILEEITPLYNSGFESGIDLIWCNAVLESQNDFAILDETPVLHSAPVGGNKAANGFTNGKKYEDDIYKILEIYSLPWLPCIPYAAVNKKGETLNSRSILFFHALSTAFSIPPKRPIWKRYRPVLVHLKHMLTETPKNIKILLKNH